MEKKAQNHVVLRVNVDVLQGIKGKGEERRRNSFSTKAKVFCVPVCACGIRIFEYNRLAANFFHVRFKLTTIRGGPLSQDMGPRHFNRSGTLKFILSPLAVVVVC